MILPPEVPSPHCAMLAGRPKTIGGKELSGSRLNPTTSGWAIYCRLVSIPGLFGISPTPRSTTSSLLHYLQRQVKWLVLQKVGIGAHVSERQVAGKVVKSNHCPGGKHSLRQSIIKSQEGSEVIWGSMCKGEITKKQQ